VYSLVGDEVDVSEEKNNFYNQVQSECLKLVKTWAFNNCLLNKSEAKLKFEIFPLRLNVWG